MEKEILSHGDSDLPTATDSASDIHKENESSDFEYVTNTDLSPPFESDPFRSSTSASGMDLTREEDNLAKDQSSESSLDMLHTSAGKIDLTESLLDLKDKSSESFIAAESGYGLPSMEPEEKLDSSLDKTLVAVKPPALNKDFHSDDEESQGSEGDVSPKESAETLFIPASVPLKPEVKVIPKVEAPAEKKSEQEQEMRELELSKQRAAEAVKLQELKQAEEVRKKPAEPEDTAEDVLNEPIELFCKMGLDAWFNPERLHPKVVELVYWRDPKKSGIVLGSGLGVLLSLSFFSLISVVAYLSLLALTGTICFRVYKNVLQAVQKTSDGHPFKDILELDLTLPQDKVREVTDVAVAHLNAALVELRRLFLVEDLIDSIKFGVLLWCMTYLGSWFNGMTLIIIAFVAMFTLPKVYENNKSQIDHNLDIVKSKLADISAKVKAAVPIGKKPAAEEKKEQ